MNHKDHIEAFQEYHQHMEKFKFLFYCRDCMKNFKTKVRVDMCARCGNGNIVELPAIITKENKMSMMDVGLQLKQELVIFLTPPVTASRRFYNNMLKPGIQRFVNRLSNNSPKESAVNREYVCGEELPTY